MQWLPYITAQAPGLWQVTDVCLVAKPSRVHRWLWGSGCKDLLGFRASALRVLRFLGVNPRALFWIDL